MWLLYKKGTIHMICKKCGKEIPDDAKFCGFCGTPVISEDVSEQGKDAEPATEESVKDVENTSETPKEEDNGSPSIGADISHSLKDTAAGKAVLGDDGRLDAKDFARMGNAAKDQAQRAYSSVNWAEFKLFLAILKDPFGDHALALLPSIVVVIAALLVNWMIFTSFFNALVVTAVVYAGYFLLLYINKEEKQFDGKKAFGKASQWMTLPIIAMLVMGLFAISMKSSLTVTSATMNSLSTYLYTLRSSVVIVLLFLTFAVVMYTIGMVEAGKKMNKYLLAVIITAVFGVCIFYLISQGLSSLLSAL